MARQLRALIPGGLHHITARGNDKQPLFVDDGDRRTFLATLRDAASTTDAVVLAFCLMTNHVHLVVRDDEMRLSQMLHRLNSVYAQRFNRRHGRTGHVFEGRFWNSLIESDAYLAVAVEYVHRNPLEAGIVDRLDEYIWSSYQAYLGKRRPNEMLECQPVLDLYGGDRAALRSATENRFRDWSKESELARPHPAPILGSEAFVRQVAAGCDFDAETEPSRRKLALERSASLEVLVALAAEVLGVDGSEITDARPGSKNMARSVTLHVAHEIGRWTLKEIATYFGVSSASAVTMASRRCSEILAKDLQAAALADALRRLADDNL